MVYRCKSCGGALEYSAETNMMVCKHCNNSYSVDEVSTDSVSDIETESKAKTSEKWLKREQASIKMQIMRCTSCGAELAVNGVETSTFCAYCGQATVVADRVEDYLKPEYIIPFKITRNDAEAIIRRHLNKGFFVPEKIKKFEVEKIRGIYVPFWLFDVDYKDSQYWKYYVKSGKKMVTRYEYFEGKTSFKRLTLDASRNLNDESSSRLEPYDMRELKEFDMAYLSGYYSDRFDVGLAASKSFAAERAYELFNEGVKKELKHKEAEIAKSNPEYKITKAEYALLPAWFLSFIVDDKTYTILVNGQTGKTVGAVPIDKVKAISLFTVIALVLCVISIAVCIAFSEIFFVGIGFESKGSMKLVAYYILGLPAGLLTIGSIAVAKFKALKKSLSLTTSGKIHKFAKERQDR